jgi:hypothetical protein
VTPIVVALVLAAGVVVDAAAEAGRVPELVVAVGLAGCVLMVVAFLGRWPSVLPVGLVGVGAAYAISLALRSGAVDAAAPAVAAALFVAAELGFWALERSPARAERQLLVRRISGLAVGALGTALVGSLVLGLTAGVSGGVALEAAGVAAAALTVAAIALLASRVSG